MLSTEEKKQLKVDNKKYIWPPFTRIEDYFNEEQLIIEEGEGCSLRDIDGNSYIDGISSLWVNIHGHNREEINRAMIDQIEKISHASLFGQSNIPAIKLARKLVEISPEGLDKVFYSDTGATAVEIALKIAFQYWQQIGAKNKTKFISLKNGYHGDTIGAMSVGDINLYNKIYQPLLFPTIKVESPYCYRCPFRRLWPECDLYCIDQMEELMQKESYYIAALIIEPMIQAAGGMIVFPQGYLTRVRELCTEYNILMIADEIATGWGRTGKIFACEHEEVRPDIMLLAKGITGGYLPLAATLTSQKIFDAFLGKDEEQKTFYHGHTYTGNPIACSAALASIDLFEKDKTLENLQKKIILLKEKLRPFSELSHVGEVRQAGFMVGIELVKDKQSKESFSLKDNIEHKVILKAREKGVILRPLRNVIVIMPPLNISQKDLRELVEVTYQSIKEVTAREN